jgi:hypothetical protein
MTGLRLLHAHNQRPCCPPHTARPATRHGTRQWQLTPALPDAKLPALNPIARTASTPRSQACVALRSGPCREEWHAANAQHPPLWNRPALAMRCRKRGAGVGWRSAGAKGADHLIAQELRRQGRASWASDWPAAGPHQLAPPFPPIGERGTGNKLRDPCIDPATIRCAVAAGLRVQAPLDVITKFTATGG